jgi:hypothetical protein
MEDPAGSLRQLPNPLHAVAALHASPEEVVRELVQSRKSQLDQSEPHGTLSLDGRLLLYFPDAELADGAAEEETHGFFDVYNTPAWDTWIALFEDPTAHPSLRRCLLAFVPVILVPLVDRGIYVNPEECIRWLDDASAARFGL